MQNATATRRSSKISLDDWLTVVDLELRSLDGTRLTVAKANHAALKALASSYKRGDSGAVGAKKAVAAHRQAS